MKKQKSTAAQPPCISMALWNCYGTGQANSALLVRQNERGSEECVCEIIGSGRVDGAAQRGGLMAVGRSRARGSPWRSQGSRPTLSRRHSPLRLNMFPIQPSFLGAHPTLTVRHSRPLAETSAQPLNTLPIQPTFLTVHPTLTARPHPILYFSALWL